jgi:4-diphosphocytidyl-2-C-methyl-D-erythritol kinase
MGNLSRRKLVLKGLPMKLIIKLRSLPVRGSDGGEMTRGRNLAMVTVRCAAKVNLFLDILGKREDGYHEIVSVMCSVDVRDTLVVTPLPLSEGFKITVSGAEIPTGKENTIWKAAEALSAFANTQVCAFVRLYKQIPVAAGLGGGSSNAAGAIVALNKLLGLGLKRHELFEVAKSVGADVPFFLLGGFALVKGIGDLLTPLDVRTQLWMLLVKPPGSVPTAWAYKVWDTKGKQEHRDPTPLIEALQNGDLIKVGQHLYNAFEAVVSETHTEISYIKSLLKNTNPLGVVMSGSGPTLVALFGSEKDARRAKEIMHEELKRSYEGSSILPNEASLSSKVWMAVASTTKKSLLVRFT